MAFTPPTYASALPIVRAQAPKKKQQDGGFLSDLAHFVPNIGLDKALESLIHIPGGIYNLATGGGDFTHYGDTWGAAGSGILQSFANTAATPLRALGVPGTEINLSTPYKAAIADIFGKEHRPKDIWERSYGHGQPGLVPSLIEDIGNVALAGGAAAKLAKVGELGQVADAAAAAERAGAGLESAARATKLEAKLPRPLEEMKAAIPAEQLQARMRLLNTLHRVEHPYNALFQEGLRPLTRASNEAALTSVAGESVPGVGTAAGTVPDAGTLTERGMRMATQNQAPIPQWATTTVERLPQSVQDVLSGMEGFIQRRQTQRLGQDKKLEMNAAQHEEMRSADTQLRQNIANYLEEKSGGKLDRAAADEMAGNTILARAEGRIGDNSLESVVSGQTGLTQKLDIGPTIPEEMLQSDPALRQALDNAVASAKETIKRGEEIQLSSRLGNKGLENIGSDEVQLSKAAQSAARDLEKLRAQRDKLKETALPKERTKMERDIAVAERRLQAAATSVDAARAARESALASFDQSRQLGDQATGTIPAVSVEDVQRELQGRQLEEGLTPGQRTQRNLASQEIMGKGEVYRRGVKGGRAREAAGQANRNLIDAIRVKKQSEQAVADLRAAFDEGGDVQRTVNALEGKISSKEQQLGEMMANPAHVNIPPRWQPLWRDMEKIASDPDMVEALGGADWTTNAVEFIRYMKEQGVDPSYIPSMTRGQVDKLLYRTLDFSDMGHEVTSGARAARTGKLANLNAEARGIDLITAHMVRVRKEAIENSLVDYLEQAHARPVLRDADGKAVVPDGYQPWADVRRSFFPTHASNEATTYAGAEMMVPNSVVRYLKANMNRIDSDWLRTLNKVTSPWRLFALMLSPKWLVNNFAGNMMIATLKEGARPQDFLKAARAFKKNPAVLDALGKPMRFTGEGADVAAIAGHSTMADVTREGTLVPNAPGIAGLKQSAKEGGLKAAKNYAIHRIGRMNEVVDEMARAGVYFKELRKGATKEQALLHAQQALVDFTDLSPLEQGVVRSFIPFYAWQKGILKVVAKEFVDNPKVVAILNMLAEADKAAQRERFPGGLPRAYEGVITLPGGININTRGLNPFADSGSLLSPEGAVSSINPFVQAALRQGFHAPASGYPKGYTVDDFGRAVADVPMGATIAETLGNLPIARLAQNAGVPITGAPGQGAAQGGINFLGAGYVSPEQLSKAQERLGKARKQVSNKARGTKAKKARAPKPRSNALPTQRASFKPRLGKLSLAQKIAHRKQTSSIA